MVTPSYWAGNQWSPPQSSQTKDGRATDSCLALVGVHQCGVLMEVLGWLAAYVSTTSTRFVVSNKGRQSSQHLHQYNTLMSPNKGETAVCGSTTLCLGWLGRRSLVPDSIGRSHHPPACLHCLQWSWLVQGLTQPTPFTCTCWPWIYIWVEPYSQLYIESGFKKADRRATWCNGKVKPLLEVWMEDWSRHSFWWYTGTKQCSRQSQRSYCSCISNMAGEKCRCCL